MKRLFAISIYTALTLGATPSFADTASIAGLREGDMRKLVLHDSPQATSSAAFQLDGATNAKETSRTLEFYQGKYVLVNFWATWCAPCRKEMPMLSQLQKEYGGDQFEVITIATGRNTPQGITKFFSDNNIENLPKFQDPKQALASQMGVFGLPITVLLNPEGQEIARLRGDADWSSSSAKAIISALINPN